MKISKYLFLKIIAKHLHMKLNKSAVPTESHLQMMVMSLMPMFTNIAGNMIQKGILDDEGYIDVDLLEKECNQFFSIVPTLQIPFGDARIVITKEDADKFLKELAHKADVINVIALPCQQN